MGLGGHWLTIRLPKVYTWPIYFLMEEKLVYISLLLMNSHWSCNYIFCIIVLHLCFLRLREVDWVEHPYNYQIFYYVLSINPWLHPLPMNIPIGATHLGKGVGHHHDTHGYTSMPLSNQTYLQTDITLCTLERIVNQMKESQFRPVIQPNPEEFRSSKMITGL